MGHERLCPAGSADQVVELGDLLGHRVPPCGVRLVEDDRRGGQRHSQAMDEVDEGQPP